MGTPKVGSRIRRESHVDQQADAPSTLAATPFEWPGSRLVLSDGFRRRALGHDRRETNPTNASTRRPQDLTAATRAAGSAGAWRRVAARARRWRPPHAGTAATPSCGRFDAQARAPRQRPI
ncbi:MAG: hypothetical protein MZW92_54610 [Comamonadaceae bacterium]|nr:hypothetical protein [Comamonadaceae bacterium]